MEGEFSVRITLGARCGVSYWVKTKSTSQNEDQTALSALLGGRRSEELDPGDL